MSDLEERFECPTCGAIIGIYAANCYNCGCELEWDDEEQEINF